MKKPIEENSKKDLHKTFIFLFSGINFIVFSSNLLRYAVLKRQINDSKFHVQALPESLRDTFLHDGYYNKKNLTKEEATCIEEFLDVLRRLDHVDLTNFYVNIHPDGVNLQQIEHPFGFKVLGEYVPKTNEIHYDVANIRDVIFHELLHLASTCIWGPYCFCGFDQTKSIIKKHQSKEEYRIGVGLNEGYTELLSRRYFPNKNTKPLYPILVDLAFFIESLVGQKKMEEYYFKGNLYAFIQELEQYASKKEVLMVLKRMDFIHNALYETVTVLPKIYIKTVYNEIILSLARMLMIKIKYHKDMMDPDIETLKSEVALFYSLKNHICKEDFLSLKSSNRTKSKLDLYANMILEDSPHIKRFSKERKHL